MARLVGVLVLAIVPAVAEACATCIASAYGDRTFNWAFLSLLLVPFGIAAGIGTVIFVAYRRSAAGHRAFSDEAGTTAHLLSKETT